MSSPLMNDAESQYPRYAKADPKLYSDNLYDNAVLKTIAWLKARIEKSSNEGNLNFSVYTHYVPEVTDYFKSLGITIKRKRENGCMFGRKYTQFSWDKSTNFNKI